MNFVRVAAVIAIAWLSSMQVTAAEEVRTASAAGMFYPSDSTQLYKLVDSLLRNARLDTINGTPIAFVCPHAGFVFSGPTSAKSYRLIGSLKNLKTVIILGFQHNVATQGASVWTQGFWETPLGRVQVDSVLARKILASGECFNNNAAAFANEHSLETQLPFLQLACKGISIVPIQIGFQNKRIVESCAAKLSEVLKKEKNFVIVASSDMSHYKTRADCRRIDSVTAARIQSLDGMSLWNSHEEGNAELCGAAPVAVALIVARNLGATDVKVLKRGDSGDYSGDLYNVVGYLSAVAYQAAAGDQASANDPNGYLSAEERRVLLRTARQAIEAYLDGRSIPQASPPAGKLTANGAAFVTITKNGQLRGCIGFTEAFLPLYQTVATCAVKAASEDPRFPPLTEVEYPQVELEISVLTPLVRTSKIEDIVVGRHGLMVKKGPYRGLLLPQVASQYGWDRETFLDETCQKAGLPPGCWKEDCEIYTFSAEVFGEKQKL